MIALYSLALLVSAVLLFLLEPMVDPRLKAHSARLKIVVSPVRVRVSPSPGMAL